MMNACADDMSMDSLKGTVTKDDVDSPAIRIESLVSCRDDPWMRGHEAGATQLHVHVLNSASASSAKSNYRG